MINSSIGKKGTNYITGQFNFITEQNYNVGKIQQESHRLVLGRPLSLRF